MNFTDSQYDNMIEVAKRIGAEDGKYSTHVCDLSGEWADRPTSDDILKYIYVIALQEDVSLDADDFFLFEDVDKDYILDFYENEYNNSYWEYHNEASN